MADLDAQIRQLLSDYETQIEAAREAVRAAQERLGELEWKHARLLSALGEVREGLTSVPSRPNTSQMLGRSQAEDSRALKIAKTRSSGRKRDPAYQAILDAGMTPDEAAAVCGTTRDVLKQCWGKGKQFREIRQDWKKRLAAKGVPATVWRTKN